MYSLENNISTVQVIFKNWSKSISLFVVLTETVGDYLQNGISQNILVLTHSIFKRLMHYSLIIRDVDTMKNMVNGGYVPVSLPTAYCVKKTTLIWAI